MAVSESGAEGWRGSAAAVCDGAAAGERLMVEASLSEVAVLHMAGVVVHLVDVADSPSGAGEGEVDGLSVAAGEEGVYVTVVSAAEYYGTYAEKVAGGSMLSHVTDVVYALEGADDGVAGSGASSAVGDSGSYVYGEGVYEVTGVEEVSSAEGDGALRCGSRMEGSSAGLADGSVLAVYSPVSSAAGDESEYAVSLEG